jgi:hypothetical protein
MKPSFSAVLGVWVIAVSCGGDRKNPTLPNEYEPIGNLDAAEGAAEVAGGSDTLESDNLPIEGTDGTIFQTPQEGTNQAPSFVNCSRSYEVSAATNPFLAGMPEASIIDYASSADKAPVNSPVQILPNDLECMKPGNSLYFRVDGNISLGDIPGEQVNADGQSTLVVSHKLGSVNHIATTNAPMGSLIGVFLDDTPTHIRTITPKALRFGRETLRNFRLLAPAIGQIFFIGDGKDSAGTQQAFLIPQGATRLFIATMDADQWNNNIGKFTVQALWLKP